MNHSQHKMDVTNRNKTQVYQTQDFISVRGVESLLFHDGQCFPQVTIEEGFGVQTLEPLKHSHQLAELLKPKVTQML